MNQDYLEIASVIKRLRKANQMTQVDLAKATSFSQASIVAYEAGKTEPGYIFLKKLREVFGYDLFDDNISTIIFERTYDKHDNKKVINEKSGAVTPDYLLTLRKQLSTALVSLQEAIETLPQPVGPEKGAVGDSAFRQAGKTKKTEKR